MATTRQRKTIAERLKALDDKKKKLEQEQRAKQAKVKRQIALLAGQERAKERKADNHLKIVFGAGVMAHARISATWAKELQAVLQKATTKEHDKKLTEEWFLRLDTEQKQEEQDKARPQK